MAIKIKQLTHIYNEGTPFEKVALHDANLHIKDGSFLGIIGHTGSGKSTLIQMFNGLLKPTRGEVYVKGINIHEDGVDKKHIRQSVGLVFQYPEYQLFEMTVYDDVAYGPKNLGLEGDALKERIESSLKAVGLDEEFWQKSPFELSGGQKRRVAIAGVLAMNPDILILDEPTNHLDMESITALNNGMIKFPGVLLFASHDHQIVQTTANRIMEILPNGVLIDKITTYDEYLASDEMARKRQVYTMTEEDN